MQNEEKATDGRQLLLHTHYTASPALKDIYCPPAG